MVFFSGLLRLCLCFQTCLSKAFSINGKDLNYTQIKHSLPLKQLKAIIAKKKNPQAGPKKIHNTTSTLSFPNK